jgi:GT2 family glycosyltransferase
MAAQMFDDRAREKRVHSFINGPVSIQVQSVLYNLPFNNVLRTLEYVEQAGRLAMAAGLVSGFVIAYGDCSPHQILNEEKLSALRQRFPAIRSVSYTYFNANLGSAEGHNRLTDAARNDLIMVLNPDVLLAPNAFIEMIKTLRTPGVGLVEARQIPIEHPKDFDRETGETSWASTACVLVPAQLARSIGKFDSKAFFLYCDDVDFSWRIRLSGYRVVYQPRAAVFHDKRLSKKGSWIASSAERYYSAEAALFLMYKYSREDRLSMTLEYFRKSNDDTLLKAALIFEERRKNGSLPIQLDGDHKVAQFIDGNYALHRFKPI